MTRVDLLQMSFPLFALLFASPVFSQETGGIPGGILGAGPAQNPRQTQPATCAVDGMVVDGATGVPLARAHVSIGGMGPGASGVTTDAQGRWSLTGVACGIVQISAQKTGYLVTMYGQTKLGQMARPLRLQDGNPTHDIKLQLMPQSVVLGKVVDETGEPMQNVQVQVIAHGTQEGKRTWQPRGGAQTNDLGEFRLFGLNPGKYIVCAHPNMAPGPMGSNRHSVYVENCYPGPAEGNSAATLDLQPGRETKVDFTMTPTAGVSIRGTISGSSKTNGAGIQLRKRGSANMGFQGHPVNLRPDGTFEVSGVAPGSYYVFATSWDGQGQRQMSAQTPVDVGSSDVEGVNLQLSSGFAITGTVRIEKTAAGSAVAARTGPEQIMMRASRGPNDATGAPLNLMVRPSEGQMGPSAGQVKWSDDKKSFSVDNVTPGRYRIDVFPMGSYYVKSMSLQGREILNQEIALQQATGPVEIVLADDLGRVEGTLKGADGQPATGQVLLIPDNGGRPQFLFSSPEGKFTSPIIPPGSYKAYSWTDPAQAEWANPDWLRQFGSEGVPVVVTGGQTAKADLKQVEIP